LGWQQGVADVALDIGEELSEAVGEYYAAVVEWSPAMSYDSTVARGIGVAEALARWGNWTAWIPVVSTTSRPRIAAQRSSSVLPGSLDPASGSSSLPKHISSDGSH